MKLDGKTALVFGGSSGLGGACVEACAKEGATVVIADIAVERSEALVASIVSNGGNAAFVRTDATDDDAVKAAIDHMVLRFGKLDVLVNSAGALSAHNNDGWHRSIDIFLKAPYYACRHAVPAMVKSGGGSIINIASLAGVTGSIAKVTEGTGYVASKHGLIGITRTLALAYAADNVRVNAICPGYIKTEMNAKLHDVPDGGEAHVKEVLRVPMGRWGRPEEIGKVAAFLASDDASFITGQPIVVDGGFMAR